ncbi:MAG: ABC transporter permease [Anaerolineales bacterium]|nr:ABC transporter permease [Anaerolineales bacterium]
MQPADLQLEKILVPVEVNRAKLLVRRLFRNRSAVVGMVILFTLTLIAIFAPLLAPYDPEKPLIGIEQVKKREAPCIHLLGCPQERPQHLFGIDGNVRDVFSRVLFGARLSLIIGFTTVSFAIVVGTTLGLLSGYLGGWLDNTVMRALDVLLAFPSLLLAIAIVTVLGPGLINALLAIGIVSIPAYARVTRASVILIKELDYVSASVALGASDYYLMLHHILPNSLTPLIVQGTLGVATAILDAAALSFLGLGAQHPTPEWGLMVGQEYKNIFNAPHLTFFPGISLMLVVLGFNMLGDGLRDLLDPRLAKRLQG